MDIYYFFSDFDSKKGFSKEVALNLKKDLIKSENITFIASDPDGYGSTDKYSGIYIKWFSYIDINFKKVNIIDNRMTKTEMQQCLKNTDVIFIMGGKTRNEYNFIKNNKLDDIIKKSRSCIIGISAGAINMAENSLSSEDYGIYENITYKGIGLADISVEPHFDIKKINPANKKIMEISQHQKIYAMCDNSAIISRDSEKYFYGEIYLIYKNEIVKI